MDRFLIEKPSRYTSVDDQATQVNRYEQEHFDGKLNVTKIQGEVMIGELSQDFLRFSILLT